jgi:arabinofuranosyltransferase
LYPFAEEGLQLRAAKTKAVVVTGIGMLGYYAGPEVHIIDELGLGDPLLSRLKPASIKDWHIAHFARAMPDGYFQTVESGENQIKDPALAEYYDKLHLITSGDIWTAARWEAIWKMNTGQYDYLINAYMKSR